MTASRRPRLGPKAKARAKARAEAKLTKARNTDKKSKKKVKNTVKKGTGDDDGSDGMKKPVAKLHKNATFPEVQRRVSTCIPRPPRETIATGSCFAGFCADHWMAKTKPTLIYRISGESFLDGARRRSQPGRSSGAETPIVLKGPMTFQPMSSRMPQQVSGASRCQPLRFERLALPSAVILENVKLLTLQSTEGWLSTGSACTLSPFGAVATTGPCSGQRRLTNL